MLSLRTVIVFVSLLIVSASNATAQFSASYVEIDSLINDGVRKNSALISDRSRNLTDSERQLLLKTNESHATWYTVMNWASGGLSIGSIVQGDQLGFVAGGLGLTMWSIGLTGDRDRAGNGYIGVAVVTWIVSLFLPGIYASGEDGRLENALGLRGISSVSVTPRMDLLANGSPVPVLMLSVGL